MQSSSSPFKNTIVFRSQLLQSTKPVEQLQPSPFIPHHPIPFASPHHHLIPSILHGKSHIYVHPSSPSQELDDGQCEHRLHPFISTKNGTTSVKTSKILPSFRNSKFLAPTGGSSGFSWGLLGDGPIPPQPTCAHAEDSLDHRGFEGVADEISKPGGANGRDPIPAEGRFLPGEMGGGCSNYKMPLISVLIVHISSYIYGNPSKKI